MVRTGLGVVSRRLRFLCRPLIRLSATSPRGGEGGRSCEVIRVKGDHRAHDF